MKLYKIKTLAIVSALALTGGLISQDTNAQTTETVTSTVTVQSGFTVSVTNGLLFGTVGMTLDGTNNVTYALDAADGETFTPAGGTSNMVSIVGGQSAEVAVQGPIATDISMVIPSSTLDPLDDGGGGGTFALSDFVYNDQSASPNSGTISLDTPVTVTLDAANTDEDVLIGATITAVGSATYADATYTGSFEVKFQY